MIHIENLSKKYGSQKVLDVPNLEIPRGQSFGLVGNNGAGKTTLALHLNGILQPHAGTITVSGIPVVEKGLGNPAWAGAET